MIDYKAGLAFLEGYAAHFEELEEKELTKLRLMHERKPEAVTAVIPEEQALIMKTNILERSRTKLFGALNLDQITESAPEGLKKDYERLTKRIRTAVYQTRDLNEIIKLMSAERLKRAQRANKQLETYNDRGSVSTRYRNNLPDIKV
jgi:predicted nucleotidyltransferase